MDDISKLLQEAAPLYHARRARRRRILYNSSVLAVVVTIGVPFIINTRMNHVDIDRLYAELYAADTVSEYYYIDEFDAIGII